MPCPANDNGGGFVHISVATNMLFDKIRRIRAANGKAKAK